MTDLLTEEMVEKACCAEHGKDWRNYYNKKDQDFLFEATRRAILAILRMMVEACAKVAENYRHVWPVDPAQLIVGQYVLGACLKENNSGIAAAIRAALAEKEKGR